MKFKIDENLPVDLVALLEHAGHEAESVYQEQLQGAPDFVLLSACQQKVVF